MRFRIRVGLLFAVALGISTPSMSQDVYTSDSFPNYQPLADLQTLEAHRVAINNGDRSILQDSAEAHGARLITPQPTRSTSLRKSSRAFAPSQFRPRPPRRPDSVVDRLMDKRSVTQERLDSSSCQGAKVDSFLQGANNAEDQKIAAQAIGKMDAWFPGWSEKLLALHMTIVVSDRLSPGFNGFCAVGDGDQSILLLNREDMKASSLGPVLWLAQGLAHEANHVFNAYWTRPFCAGSGQSSSCLDNRRADEVDCLMQNAHVLRAAAADPDYADQAATLRSGANQQQFGAEQTGRTNLPIFEVYDAEKYAWSFSAYWQAVRYLVEDGMRGDLDVTLISSRREATTRDASPDARYTFEFKKPDGTPLTYQFHLDETGEPIGPPH